MTAKEAQKTVPDGVGAFVAEVVKVFVLAATVIIPIRMFLFQPFLVQGASMDPNFHDGQYLIIDEIGYKRVTLGLHGAGPAVMEPSKELARGDVAVFRYPKNPSQYFIKRVVGLPGERIVVDRGVVTIYNTVHPEGVLLDESYLDAVPEDDTAVDLVIPTDAYFVMGDNRDGSYDSRSWGPLGKEHVIGRAAVRLWPVAKFAIF